MRLPKYSLVAVSIFTLGGCATYTTTMRHPQSRDIEMCQANGAGLIPMAMAKSQHDECVSRLRELGYVPVAASTDTKAK